MRRLVASALLALSLAACDGGRQEAEGTSPVPPGIPADTTDATAPDAPVASDGSTEPVQSVTGSEEPGSTGGGSSNSARAQPLAGLPRWTAGYEGWTKLNARPIPPRGSDPHLGTKNVFASRPASGGRYPPGTVIVKEASRPGKDFIGLIAAMRKVPGRNPEHKDWVFVEWTRESARTPFSELASGAVCTSCHLGVAGRDYVFTDG